MIISCFGEKLVSRLELSLKMGSHSGRCMEAAEVQAYVPFC